MGKKLSKEFETFIGDRMKSHDGVMKKSDGWLKGKEKDLNKMERAADGFDAKMEKLAGDIEKWISSRNQKK
ncbi:MULTISPECIES: hypothetical protein [Bacillaceae]|uniref:CsbD family protein n=1 Tax=Metabacillus sediminis TaxID=3117746 RepID=A0ABZ2NLE2_9BACI|nr:hypothetical protein [Bacillus sp. SJS]KZZ83682.1 hypothetical protein AS29_015365 [Bacillus sp. SJS]